MSVPPMVTVKPDVEMAIGQGVARGPLEDMVVGDPAISLHEPSLQFSEQLYIVLTTRVTRQGSTRLSAVYMLVLIENSQTIGVVESDNCPLLDSLEDFGNGLDPPCFELEHTLYNLEISSSSLRLCWDDADMAAIFCSARCRRSSDGLIHQSERRVYIRVPDLPIHPSLEAKHSRTSKIAVY